jgi:hypothetical protein
MIADFLLAVQVPANYGDQLMGSLHAYEDCMKSTTLRLGSGNREPGDTVVAAARSECREQWEQYVAMVPGYPDYGMMRVRSRVEGEALAGLLEARATRP